MDVEEYLDLEPETFTYLVSFRSYTITYGAAFGCIRKNKFGM